MCTLCMETCYFHIKFLAQFTLYSDYVVFYEDSYSPTITAW